MLFDTHLHSSFSADSDTAPEKQIERAKETGLDGMIFTDHMDLDIPAPSSPFILDIEKYIPYINDLSRKYGSSDFYIGCGIELGLMPHLASKNKEIIENNPFDYVIGSVHICNGKDPYYDEYFKDRPVREAYLEYFQCVLDNLRAYDDFDSLGHMDYVVRYGMRVHGQAGKYEYRDYADLIDEILKTLIGKDKALEVNMGAFRCNMTEPNPGIEILKRYKELGGRMLTVGADAHVPNHVGLNFKSLPDILASAGFDSYYIFKKRKPVEVGI